MPLGRIREPFADPDWIFEIKWDGFRSLVHLQDGVCRLVSRNGNTFKSFSVLDEAIATELAGRSAVLDGEIVCLDTDGKTRFRDLLFRRGEPRFYAFDLLQLDGEDLRLLPLIKRKQRLRSLVPKHDGDRLLDCDHIEADGEGLFRVACEHDLEGIVAKQKTAPYRTTNESTWFKIRNRSYSQWIGREELFERERQRDPDLPDWDSCVRACAAST